MTDRTERVIHWARAVDRSVALANVENKAEWVRRDAEGLASYVRMIERLPEYDTQAEAAVQDAELALTEALLAVKLARSEMAKKRTHLIAAE